MHGGAQAEQSGFNRGDEVEDYVAARRQLASKSRASGSLLWIC